MRKTNPNAKNLNVNMWARQVWWYLPRPQPNTACAVRVINSGRTGADDMTFAVHTVYSQRSVLTTWIQLLHVPYQLMNTLSQVLHQVILYGSFHALRVRFQPVLFHLVCDVPKEVHLLVENWLHVPFCQDTWKVFTIKIHKSSSTLYSSYHHNNNKS